MTDTNRTTWSNEDWKPEYDDGFTKEIMDIRERSRGSFRYGHPLAKRFGGPHALISISEECGLRQDLEESFGETGDCILASAISLILTSRNIDNPMANLDMFMAREMLGISDRICDDLMPDFVDRMLRDNDGIENLYHRRISRAGDVYVTDDSFQKETDNNGPSLAIVSDASGTPVLLTRIPLPEDGDFTETGLDFRLREMGAEKTTAIFEKLPGTVDMYDSIIKNGSRFISITKQDINELIKLDEVVCSDWSEHLLDGVRYRVTSIKMAIIDCSGLDEDDTLFGRSRTHAFIGEQHPLFAQCSKDRLTTLWVFSDIDKPAVDAERVRKRIAVIERRLRSLSPSDALEQFHDTAGSLSRFFKISLNNNELNLSVDQEALDTYVSASPHVLLSYGFETWDEVMEAFKTRDSLHSMVAAMTEQLAAHRVIPYSNREGVDCIRFTAMVLWKETEKRLRKSGIEEDVSTVMEWLDDTTSVGDGFKWKIIGLTPRNRRILNILGAPVQSKEFVTMPNEQ